MAIYQFNGATASLNNAAAVAVFTDIGITSFGYEGGSRAEIDTTTSTSTRREAIAGFASQKRVSLGVLFETDPTIVELDALMEECGSSTLSIKLGSGCAAAAEVFNLPVQLMSYTVNGSMDSVLDVTMEFMVNN
jgi:hypothetical protein